MPRGPYSGPWPRIRREVLDRDGRICQIRGPRCTINANHVDHIVPIIQGGAWWDKTNLRAACGTCNRVRNKQASSFQWMASQAFITLVTGPDASAYVEQNRQPSDTVIDLAALTHALGEQAAAQAYTLLITQLRRGELKAARVWITSQHSDAEDSLPHHKVVRTGPTPQERSHGHDSDERTAGPSRVW